MSTLGRVGNFICLFWVRKIKLYLQNIENTEKQKVPNFYHTDLHIILTHVHALCFGKNVMHTIWHPDFVLFINLYAFFLLLLCIFNHHIQWQLEFHWIDACLDVINPFAYAGKLDCIQNFLLFQITSWKISSCTSFFFLFRMISLEVPKGRPLHKRLGKYVWQVIFQKNCISLYILDTSLLLNTWFTNIFSQLQFLFFIFLTGLLQRKSFKFGGRSNLLIFLLSIIHLLSSLEIFV